MTATPHAGPCIQGPHARFALNQSGHDVDRENRDVHTSRMLKNLCNRCHSERSEESRSGTKGLARFLVACGSSE